MNTLQQYAPWLIVAYCFLKDKHLFVTPSEMAQIKADLLKEVEARFLSLLAFKQFEKRIDDQLNASDERQDRMDKKLDQILAFCSMGRRETD